MWFIINATNRCNLNCRTCLRSKRAAGDLEPELLKTTIPKLTVLGFSGISITGGEPALHPQFGKLVKTVVSEGLLLGIVTNGVLYRKYIEVLQGCKNRVHFVAVSLDSHQREINDYIRGKGSFDSATKAIKEFKQRGFFVKVSHVVNKKNLKDLSRFIDFVLGLGADAVNILGTIRTPENRELVLDEREKDEFHAKLKLLRLIYKNSLHCASSTGYSNTPIFCNNFSEMNDMTLDFEGDLIFCCDTIYRGAVLGNVQSAPFENLIDRHLKIQYLLKSARLKSVMENRSKETNDCNFCNNALKHMIRS